MYFSLKRFPWTEFALSSKSTIMKTIQCYQLIYFLLFKKNIEIYFMTYMYIIISFIDSRQSLYILIIESHISASHYIQCSYRGSVKLYKTEVFDTHARVRKTRREAVCISFERTPFLGDWRCTPFPASKTHGVVSSPCTEKRE